MAIEEFMHISLLKQMLDEIKNKHKLTKNKIKVGELKEEIIKFSKETWEAGKLSILIATRGGTTGGI